MLVLAADCKFVPEEVGCSIQHTPTNWGIGLLGDGRLPFKEEITGSKPVRSTKYTRVSPLATNEEKGNWITWEFESLRECQIIHYVRGRHFT